MNKYLSLLAVTLIGCAPLQVELTPAGNSQSMKSNQKQEMKSSQEIANEVAASAAASAALSNATNHQTQTGQSSQPVILICINNASPAGACVPRAAQGEPNVIDYMKGGTK
jgi:hypothetical protein